MKKGTRILLIVVVALAVTIIVGGLILRQIGGDPNDIKLEDLDLKDVCDGIYQGEYATTLVSAEVEVIVKDNKILNVEILKHDCGPGHSGKAVIEDVLETQSLNVDAVSGSTMSSKVILKAVEIALKE